MYPDSLEIQNTSSQTVFVISGAKLYSVGVICLTSDVGPDAKLAGMRTSSFQNVFSWKLYAVDKIISHYLHKLIISLLVIELVPLLIFEVSMAAGPWGFWGLPHKNLPNRAISMKGFWSSPSSITFIAPSKKLLWKKALFLFFVVMLTLIWVWGAGDGDGGNFPPVGFPLITQKR